LSVFVGVHNVQLPREGIERRGPLRDAPAVIRNAVHVAERDTDDPAATLMECADCT
jgi:hypothetical protein